MKAIESIEGKRKSAPQALKTIKILAKKESR